jgi:hypothetical protein
MGGLHGPARSIPTLVSIKSGATFTSMVCIFVVKADYPPFSNCDRMVRAPYGLCLVVTTVSIVKTFDIIFGQITSRLHFDHLQGYLTRILEPVHYSQWDVG